MKVRTLVKLVSAAILLCGMALAQTPVLCFSDLTFGPNTGWNNGSTQGAAVTVWGKNFGATRGSSYITINGAQATTYAEWEAIGPARGLERITFFIPTTAASGAGTISVTVNGQISNTLPFTVAAAAIYYVDVTNGNNSNNGLTTSTAWKDILKADPANNPSGDGQYIVYVRAGTYTTTEGGGYAGFISAGSSPTGGPTKQKAIIGYPGDALPVLQAGDFWNGDNPFTYAAHQSYYTWAKLEGTGGSSAFGTTVGDYNRFVGLYLHDYYNTVSQTGILTPVNSPYNVLYGNYLKHNGCDSYKHDIYVSTYDGKGAPSQHVDIGWNEIDSPTWVSGCGYNDSHGVSLFISSHASQLANGTGEVSIHDNYCHDGNMGCINIGDGSPIGNVYLYNDVFSGGTCTGSGCYDAIFANGGCSAVYAYNNTFYLYETDTPIVYLYAANCSLTLRNNLFFGSSGQPFVGVGSFSGLVVNSDHDLYYPAATALPSGAGVTVTNPVRSNPAVVSGVVDGNFRLTSSSPAIGAGVSYRSLATDYDGTNRPNPPSIGAYESASGSASAPNPPSGLTALVN